MWMYLNVLKSLLLEDMDELQLPKATWVIIGEANGEVPDSIQEYYKNFYTEWLPNSGYDLDDLPVIECYFTR